LEKVSLHGEKGVVLGHVISRDGTEVDEIKIDFIANLAPQSYVKDVRSILGHARFYRRFIQDFSKITKPLSSLLANNVPFHFFEECLKAFTMLKEALITIPILHSYV